MDAPYTLYSENEDTFSKKAKADLPLWFAYPLPFARNKHHYKIPEMELYSQQLNHPPFFIDLVGIEANQRVHIPFTVHEKRLYLFFMLQGSLLYSTAAQRPIVRIQANTFQMSYYDKGDYLAFAEKGKHVALVMGIDPEWIKGMSSNRYYNLQEILHKFGDGKKQFETMPQCRIDKRIQRWIHKIYSYAQDNVGALDGNLRKYTSFLLEYYDKKLSDPNVDIGHMVKAYIEKNYHDETLNVQFLSERFFVIQRTLLNIFKSRYSVSIHQFITELRMEHALSLMDQKNKHISDVYMAVGYSDERSFRSALKHYLKQKGQVP